jgi:hypothetical protein
MTEIERILIDAGLDIDVLHEGAGPSCPACESVGDATRLPMAA